MTLSLTFSADPIVTNEALQKALSGVHSRNQGFYTCIDDDALVADIQAFAESVQGTYDDIVVPGIGGSALGTQTLRDSLLPLMSDQSPRLHIVDNIDPELVTAMDAQLDYSKTLFLVITKSGGTPETLSLYSYFRDNIEKAGLRPQDHIVMLTDPKKGYLRGIAERENFTTFPIPANVGGRFSVLTSVGLLPAALIGIDIKQLLAGAKEMRDLFLTEDVTQNAPYRLAAHQNEHRLNGKTDVVMMPYIQRLKTFSDWYAQLLAESTGKVNAHGVAVGLTPISALGATDQHSQVQLFAEGPNDKQYIFLNRKNSGKPVLIPTLPASDKTNFLQGKTFNQLLEVERQATVQTLQEAGRPTVSITMDDTNAHALGQLFLLFEGATAFLGEMMEINAFNQPGVERGKVLTRELL